MWHLRNMRRTKIYLVTAAALLALAGCDHALEPAGGGAITIEASVGPMTKVTYDGAGSAFAAGDQLALYAWTGTATEIPARRAVDGVVNTFDGTKWTPASLMRWQTMSTPHFFLGVSPAPGAAVADLTAVPYTLDPSPDKYAASDLLLATNFGTDGAGVKPSQTAVPLAFDHAMAKLVVNLKFRSQWAAVPAVSAVTVTAKSAATVNYLTKSVTATGDAALLALPAAASAASGYDKSFSSLQVPQGGVRRITVSIDGTDFVYEATEDIPLVSGEITTVCLNVGRDRIDLAGITVADWSAGTTLPDQNMQRIDLPELVYLGDPLTSVGVTSGQDIAVGFRANHVSEAITADDLNVVVVSAKRFFSEGTKPSDEPVRYSVKSVDPDPGVPGRYVATIATSSSVPVWEECSLALAFPYQDLDGNPAQAVTEAFPVSMIPRPGDGLSQWCYPHASFYEASTEPVSAGQTVSVGETILPIYYALDQQVFKTTDGTESKTYSADFIDSAAFVPDMDAWNETGDYPSVQCSLDKVRHFVSFTPDDIDNNNTWLEYRCSTGVKHVVVPGKLVLTDVNGVKDTVVLNLRWYNTSWFPESAILRKDSVREDNSASIDIRSMLRMLGLNYSDLHGRYDIEEEYVSDGYIYRGDSFQGGYFRMSASLDDETGSLDMRLTDPFDYGYMFAIRGRITLWIYPSLKNPELKAKQLRFSYDMAVTIVH